MKRRALTATLLLVATSVAGCKDRGGETTDPIPAVEDAAAPPQSFDASAREQDPLTSISTTGPDIRVTPLEHGSLTLTWGDRVIYVDPVSSALEAADRPEDAPPDGDLVLVTHVHGDHLDPDAIARIRKQGAPAVVPKAVAEKAGDALPSPTVLANGESTELLDGDLEVEAFPMYNLVRKRDDGQFFHPKGEGNGYLLRMGGKTIYISGDTECTPEMKALEGVDAAFLCMNLPYTMTVEEAAECVRAFEPAVLFPYHHRGQDPTQLQELLDDVASVEIRLLDWYGS